MVGRECVRPLFHWSPGATEREGYLEGRPPPPRCPSRAADPWKVHKWEAMQLGNAGGSSFSCKRLLSSGHEG